MGARSVHPGRGENDSIKLAKNQIFPLTPVKALDSFLNQQSFLTTLKWKLEQLYPSIHPYVNGLERHTYSIQTITHLKRANYDM